MKITSQLLQLFEMNVKHVSNSLDAIYNKYRIRNRLEEDKMTGTALVLNEENLVVLENIEKSVYEELQGRTGTNNCICSVNNSVVHLGKVSSVLWSEDEIDWEYGY